MLCKGRNLEVFLWKVLQVLLHAGPRSGVEREESQSSLLSIWKFKPARKKCTLNRHSKTQAKQGQWKTNSS